MRVAVFGQMRFPPEQRAAILPHLKTLIEATRRNDGCIAYDVAEDVLDPGLFRFSELWPDQETLSGHMKAPHIPPWREACLTCGIIERTFAVYDATNERGLG
ncbi:MAG TPA: putative quinol monooxygenase [Caulobacterales bacterium]|nr:putative quinol monooxygenase [Caulobacterales bacterium]